MNFIQILNRLEAYSLSLPYVNSTNTGDIYEFLNGNPGVKYASVNIDINQSTRTDNLVNYSIFLYYVDRLSEDKSNWMEIKTTAEQVLNSIINYAAKIGDVNDGWTINFFEQQFADYCAGGYVQFILEVPNEMGDCLIDEYEEGEIEYPDFPDYRIIDDNIISKDKTWSSFKINEELNNKQDTLEAGDGININSNEISVDIDYIKQEIEDSHIKQAQIRLRIYDTTQWDRMTAFVTTPVDRYQMNVQGTGTVAGAVTNLDFDIEYDDRNPLVTIMVMNVGRDSVRPRLTTGLWLYTERGGFDSYSFTQKWKPSVIAYIPYNFTTDPSTGEMSQFHGSYAGVTFQVNLKDYDLQRDGRIQLCNLQTSTMCYAEDTLITLSDGTTKMVQDITYDDVLKVWNFDEGKTDTTKPIWIKIEQESPQYALVKLSDGNSIKLVGSDGKYHCMYDVDEQKFNHAIDCVGHNVYTENGIVKVDSLEIVNEPVKFYNIVTNVHLNCYANHILTSTEKNNIYPINDMKFVKDNREFKPYETFENYGISLDDYNGWRLAEQPMSVEECVEFIKQRKQTQP